MERVLWRREGKGGTDDDGAATKKVCKGKAREEENGQVYKCGEEKRKK